MLAFSTPFLPCAPAVAAVSLSGVLAPLLWLASSAPPCSPSPAGHPIPVAAVLLTPYDLRSQAHGSPPVSPRAGDAQASSNGT
jgi:hypothetical protein